MRLHFLGKITLFVLIIGLLFYAMLIGGLKFMVNMPGKSYQGPLSELTASDKKLRDKLKGDVDTLATKIGERHVFRYEALMAAYQFIYESFSSAQLPVLPLPYEVYKKTCYNVEAECRGSSKGHEIVVIGAHYDTVFGSPGANDNGTGVAALLALTRMFAQKKISRTLRFVAFVNEEPPYFQTSLMGSLVYARNCKAQKENIVGMLSLETIGYYSDKPGSQSYPPLFNMFYPNTGNFIGFIGNRASGEFIRKVVRSFRDQVQFPSEGACMPAWIPGISWSDQWSFWKQGYPALMVTDTAPFRYPYYHTEQDVASHIDFDRFTRVVIGLEKVISDLVEVY